MELLGINGFNPFGSERYAFCEHTTKNFQVTKEHLLSLGVKENVEGVPVYGMPCFRPLDTIISADYDAVELLYMNPKNELQSVLGVRKENLCGLINMLGVQILPLLYSSIVCPINCSKPVFCVDRSSDHKRAAIDIFGKTVVPFGTYVYMWGYDHNLCLVSTEGGTFKNRAIIGIDGEIIVSPNKYVDIYGFRGKKSIIVEDKAHNYLALSVETLTEIEGSKPFQAEKRMSTSPGQNEDNRHYEDFAGSYAQDVMGYSDEDIYDAFDGDPDAYWNNKK